MRSTWTILHMARSPLYIFENNTDVGVDADSNTTLTGLRKAFETVKLTYLEYRVHSPPGSTPIEHREPCSGFKCSRSIWKERPSGLLALPSTWLYFLGLRNTMLFDLHLFLQAYRRGYKMVLVEHSLRQKQILGLRHSTRSVRAHEKRPITPENTTIESLQNFCYFGVILRSLDEHSAAKREKATPMSYDAMPWLEPQHWRNPLHPNVTKSICFGCIVPEYSRTISMHRPKMVWRGLLHISEDLSIKMLFVCASHL